MTTKINYDNIPVPGVDYAVVNYRGHVLIVEDDKITGTIKNADVVKNIEAALAGNNEAGHENRIVTDLKAILKLAMYRRAEYDAKDKEMEAARNAGHVPANCDMGPV
jgi:hypothetical protein